MRPPITVMPMGARQLLSPLMDMAVGACGNHRDGRHYDRLGRLRPVSQIASFFRHAVIYHFDGEVDEQDRVLRNNSEEHEDADETNKHTGCPAIKGHPRPQAAEKK